MKLRALAVGLGLTALAPQALADNFTVSDAFGTGIFGTLTATDLGPQPGSTDTVHVVINMAPNFIIDTGSHFALTMTFLGTGRFDPASFVGQPFFTPLAHHVPADYKNAPFQDFTDAVSATCNSGGDHSHDEL